MILLQLKMPPDLENIHDKKLVEGRLMYKVHQNTCIL
jgi:hypothetical protein